MMQNLQWQASNMMQEQKLYCLVFKIQHYLRNSRIAVKVLELTADILATLNRSQKTLAVPLRSHSKNKIIWVSSLNFRIGKFLRCRRLSLKANLPGSQHTDNWAPASLPAKLPHTSKHNKTQPARLLLQKIINLIFCLKPLPKI